MFIIETTYVLPKNGNDKRETSLLDILKEKPQAHKNKQHK